METSYLHQQRLAEAIKKLHMLGHRNYSDVDKHNRQEQQQVGKFGTSIAGSLMAQPNDQKRRAAAAAKQKLMEEQQFNEDKEFIKGNRSASPVKGPYFYDPMNPTIGAEDKNYIKYGQAGYPMPQYDPKVGLAEIDKHNAAAATSVGGYDTHQGMADRSKAAQEQGSDIETGRQMVVNGGMMNSMAGLRAPDPYYDHLSANGTGRF